MKSPDPIPLCRDVHVQALETGFPGFAFVHFAESAEADQATRQGPATTGGDPGLSGAIHGEPRLASRTVVGRFDSQNIESIEIL